MKQGLLVGVLILSCLALSASAQSPSISPLPSDAQIRQILADRIDTQKQAVGIVVGVIDAQGRRIIAHGSPAKGDQRSLDGDTVFEIGSITKVFTALLLAEMAERGEVALSDPVAKYLPEGVSVPERGGLTITLEHLAAHTSGLPRLPTNLKPQDAANPYADYSVEQLYEFLAGYELPRDIGAQYEYSNLGGGLLGHVLALRAGMAYETLVRSRIGEPLRMKSTGIALSPEMKARLAVGHNAALDAAPNWDLPTLAGAGALRSSGNDMLMFLAAMLGHTESPLRPAVATTLAARKPTPVPDLEIALGWHIWLRGAKEVIWHNGGTGGYRSFAGFDPKARVGVVVLSNTFTPAGVDDIGRHLLDSQSPLIEPPKQRQEISVDPELFDRYVGRYQLAPTFILTITREGDRLFAQATGQGKAEIFAESEREFFYKIVNAQLTFEVDGEGHTTQLTLHQNGRHMPAKRIE